MQNALRYIITLAVLGMAGPCLAQEAPEAAEDWTLTSVPDRKAVVAMIDFSSGLNIAARCVDGVYDLLITGLPEAEGRVFSRELGIQVGDDEEPYISVWTVGARRDAAFSRIPAPVARDLAQGGKLQVIVPATATAPRTRYVMELVPSSTAIEQTLTACGRPLVDPREARSDQIDGNGQDGLPDTLQWQIVPRPTFPPPVNDRMPREGYVVMSCVVQGDGRLTECLSESEQPPGFNLGRAVQRSLFQSKIRLSDRAAAAGLPLAGRMVRFSVNFKLQE